MELSNLNLSERIKALGGKVRLFLPRKPVSLLLIVLGIGLLGYVASQYWGMYRSQQKLEAEWEQQAAGFNTPAHAVIPPEQMLTRVVIPKIGLDAIVLEGASRKELSEGPGHMKETANPGDPGNAVITAHRDTFFRHIYELAKGDQIQVRRSGRLFTYEVTGKKIVMPDDVSVIRQTPDPQLTLITCYPVYYIGPAPKRLVVFSKLVDSSQYGLAQTAGAQ
jgi:LPXTG-site transpeptidase (sortase) family protein